uniref:Uncharacterized protein n=1 Tax=Plectus sambesii TaxID=2011161 RepID=A0A914WFD8_9BILA
MHSRSGQRDGIDGKRETTIVMSASRFAVDFASPKNEKRRKCAPENRADSTRITTVVRPPAPRKKNDHSTPGLPACHRLICGPPPLVA